MSINNIDFLSELKRNASLVSDILASDDFTDSIEPELLRDAVRYYPLSGGKRLRSSLLLWSCGLCGGDVKTAEFAAAAVEIYHNWTLVHDDIIDDDILRRNNPAAHIYTAELAEKKFNISKSGAEKFGRDFAILAGDLQQSWAVHMLNRLTSAGVEPERVLYLINELQAETGRLLISGEALDTEFSYREWHTVALEEIEDMLYMKTAALLQYCVTAGAVIALGVEYVNDEKVAALRDFAKYAGIAFQLKDDWLGIFAEETVTGKPELSDLSERKPTILFMDALNYLDEKGKKEFMRFAGKDSYTADDIDAVRRIIKESGAEERLRCRTGDLIDKARHALDIFSDSKYRHLMIQFADFVLNRTM